jgi:hypothetical protein
MRWVERVAGTGEMRNSYTTLVAKPKGKRPFGRRRRRWEDNIRMDPRELGKSRDSSVGIALGYGLDDRSSRVRFLAGAGSFSLHHRVQNGSRTHPASHPMGARDSFPGGKAAEMKLTTHLHLVPRSRMRGAIPPLP